MFNVHFDLFNADVKSTQMDTIEQEIDKINELITQINNELSSGTLSPFEIKQLNNKLDALQDDLEAYNKSLENLHNR